MNRTHKIFDFVKVLQIGSSNGSFHHHFVESFFEKPPQPKIYSFLTEKLGGRSWPNMNFMEFTPYF